MKANQPTACAVFRWKGRLYRPNDPVTGTDEEIADLVRQGFIPNAHHDDEAEAGAGPGQSGPGPNPGLSDDERIEAIQGILTEMLKEDPDKKVETVWKKDGSPRAKAVTPRLEFAASADEINGVWAAMQPAGDGASQ